MADFDDIGGAVEGGLEAIVADAQLSSCQEAEDGGLADACISDDDDCFVAIGVFGDARDAFFDHLFDFEEVEGVFHLNLAAN